MLKLSLFFLSFFLFFSAKPQGGNAPKKISKAKSMIHRPSIISRPHDHAKPIIDKKEVNDGRSSKNNVVPGKGINGNELNQVKNKLAGKLKTRSVDLVFEGASTRRAPSDPSLAVGPNHVFVVFNAGFEIFDKDGNSLLGPFAPYPTIFPDSGCCDLTVSYDNQADRWVISFLGDGAQVAVSDGPDPVNDGWYIYNLPDVDDYTKISVWHDGYYLTDNGSTALWVLERRKMLMGDPNAQVLGFDLPGIITAGFYSPQALNISNDDFPSFGQAPIIYMQDDAWLGVGYDHIKMWLAEMDWNNPTNSNIFPPIEFPTSPFTSVFDGGTYKNLTQPNGGTEIDALQAIIMNQAQFRRFQNHNSAIFNFVVDTDSSVNELAGIRWYEFRQNGDGQPWSMYQEGTYISPDNKHAWNGSMMMDAFGNIALGYTAMGGTNNTILGSYYTGRYQNNPLGTMTIAEEIIMVGDSNIPGSRYGDYSKMDIDPANDKRFYFINELMNNGPRDVVGRFQLASNLAHDVGVVDILSPNNGALTNSDSIKVTLYNYGISNVFGFDVSFQINGGSIITETFLDTLAPNESFDFTFSQTADLSIEGEKYVLRAYTDLTTDQFNENDTIQREITHLFMHDVGVEVLTSPESESVLTTSENITAIIKNYGTTTKSNFLISYSINAGTPVLETYSGTLSPGASSLYTFSTKADLYSLGTYDVCVKTWLGVDNNAVNNESCRTVINSFCKPKSNCTSSDDGVTSLQLANQNIVPSCSTDGYSNDTAIAFNFELNQNPFQGVLEVGYTNTSAFIWIDFNDNYIFDSNELVVEELAINQPNTPIPFTIDFYNTLSARVGSHLMRVRGVYSANTADPCKKSKYGRTNDYIANIYSYSIGVEEENDFLNSKFIIKELPDNHYDVGFEIDNNDKVDIAVLSIKGQTLAYYTLERNSKGYFNKTIDMSYVSPGIYLIKIIVGNYNKAEKIVVK